MSREMIDQIQIRVINRAGMWRVYSFDTKKEAINFLKNLGDVI